MEKVAVVIARCDQGRGACRERFVVPVDENGNATITLSAGVPPDGHDGWTNPNRKDVVMRAADAIVFLSWCIAHRTAFRGKAIKATRTSDPCGEACRKATGQTCRCSCGGFNHASE